MNRLPNLIQSLESLVQILEQDADCQWTGHFQTCLTRSRALLEKGFTQEELNALSASIMRVYGGTGSFNDYAPLVYGSAARRWRLVEGAESFSEITSQVYQDALALRRRMWQVLLIGGSSGVGKTLIAQDLARHLGISAVLVDDIRMAIQQVTTPAEHPELHLFVSDQAPRSPEQIRDGLIGVGVALAPAIEIIVAHHIVVPGAGRIIIEGDGLLPHLVTEQHFKASTHLGDADIEQQIRSVFLFEPDQQALLQNSLARGRGFGNLAPEEQQMWVRANWLYGRWLRDEARAHNLPVLSARPYDTLLNRILTAG